MKALTRYLKMREKAILSIIEKPRHKYDAETFHKLRVEIKKLNAHFELIKFCFPYFKRNKTFKPFRSISKQAGKVRELQIEEAVLSKYFSEGSLNNFLDHLKKNEAVETGIYFSMLTKKSSLQLEEKFAEIKPFTGKVTKEKAEDYISNKKTEISALINNGDLQPEQAHELRRQLKTYNYNLNSLYKQDTPPAEKEELPELLGKWHDRQVILWQLEKTHEIEGINSQEIHHLEKIKGEITVESDALFDQIKTALKTTTL